MTDIVATTLRSWRRGRFDYATGDDCMASVGAYLVRCGYPDFCAPYRGRYKTRLGALRLVNRSGGMVAMFDKTGLERGIGERGNIIVWKPGKFEICGLILDEFRAAFRLAAGVSEVNIGFIDPARRTVWSVKPCQS